MTTTVPPVRPAMKPVPPRPPAQPLSQAGPQDATFGFRPGNVSSSKIGHRVFMYGSGGIGKTTRACFAPGPVAFFDLEDSLPRLRSQLSDVWSDIGVVSAVKDFASLRECLQSNALDGASTIVIDTATKVEEWAVSWVLDNVPHEKGHKVRRIEDYGFGKGYRHVFDAYLGLLADLDGHARAGRHVILIAHDCVAEVPNAAGANWKRSEPRLQKQENGPTRLRVKEWADHVLFMSRDLVVDGDTNVGKSSGTVTIYCQEQPFCLAKTRSTCVMFDRDGEPREMWSQLFS